MFDLAKSSTFFEKMEAEHPTIVQNIEIVHDNCLALDEYYHRPKQFILSLNNLLRSLLFFIELSLKNSPQWLHGAVSEFRENNRDQYEILRELRNLSVHQKLIFPSESLVAGLFRIRSSKEYVLKLGLGDYTKPGSFSHAFGLQDTEEFFDDLLVFSSLAFMDLEHSALNECLGITRRWFYKPKGKKGEGKEGEVVEIYRLASTFSTALLDHICDRYATSVGSPCDKKFTRKMEEHNCVNTLLEIDLYPSLFNLWWEADDFEPLNYGVRVAKHSGRRYAASDEWYSAVYEGLTATPEAYRAELTKYRELSAEALQEKEHLADFVSFVSSNHWHFKRAYPNSFMNSPVKPHEVMRLQVAGKLLFEIARKNDAGRLEKAKAVLNEELQYIADALDGKRPPDPDAEGDVANGADEGKPSPQASS
jgi:hypothetical protein